MTGSPLRRAKNDAIFAAASLAVDLGLALPRAWLPTAGSWLGLVAYAILGDARRRALDNLVLVDPSADRAAARIQARAIFRRLGQNLTDTLALIDPAEDPARTLAVPPASREVLAAALAEGRGVAYMTAHLGPWERMAALLAHLGFPITTVARESYDPRFHALLYDRIRRDRSVEVIYRGQPGAPFALVRALRRGRVLGFLVDMPGRLSTRPVRFLDRPSRMPPGPARIALRARSPVVVGTPAPGEGGLWVHIARIPTDDLEAGERGEAALSQRIADALSERVRSLPEHWPWMHPSFTGPLARAE